MPAKALLRRIEELSEKLRDAEDALSAIRTGAVDALVISGPKGQKIYTLEGADASYRVLIETMNEGTLTLSPDGVILYCNARFAAMVGRPLESMMGRRFDAFLPPVERAALARLLRAGPQDPGKVAVTLLTGKRKAPLPAQISIAPLDLDGASVYCAVVTDLSGAYAMRDALLQKETGLRLLAGAAPAILFTTDARGTVLSCSGGGLRTIGGRLSELLAAPLAEGRGRLTSAAIQRRCRREGGEVCYEAVFEGRVWGLTLVAMRSGRKVAGAIGVALDVTASQQAREAKETVRREALQREFVSNVSHEFRTPLTAIQGFAETLLRGGLSDRGHARSFIETIERNALRLTGLVENLLLISTLESGSHRPAPRALNVEKLVRGMVQDLKPLASSRRISVSVDMPKGLRLFADGGQLRRVLQNVFANAVKYNKDRGALVIRGLRQNGHTRLSVSDTGIGISRADLPRIFERFHRSRDVVRQKIKGTGLGLSIAKTLVETNGGRIWAESRPGLGTTFHLSLPAYAGQR